MGYVQAVVIVLICIILAETNGYAFPLEFYELTERDQKNYVYASWIFGKPFIISDEKGKLFIWKNFNSNVKLILSPKNSRPIQLFVGMDLYDNHNTEDIEMTRESIRFRLSQISSETICYCLGTEQFCIKEDQVLNSLDKAINLKRICSGLIQRQTELTNIKQKLKDTGLIC